VQLKPLASSSRASLPGSLTAPNARMQHRSGRQWFSAGGSSMDGFAMDCSPLDQVPILFAREAIDKGITNVVQGEGSADT